MAVDNMNVVITATDRTTAAVQNIKASMGGLITQAGQLSGALAGIGAGFSAGALTASVKQAINDFDNLNKMAQKVGVSVETLSGLDFAGKLSDVSLESIGTGLKKLSVNMADAAKGGGESAGVKHLPMPSSNSHSPARPRSLTWPTPSCATSPAWLRTRPSPNPCSVESAGPLVAVVVGWTWAAYWGI